MNKKTVSFALAECTRNRLKHNGLTHQQIAVICGVSVSMVSKFLIADRSISEKMRDKLHKAYYLKVCANCNKIKPVVSKYCKPCSLENAKGNTERYSKERKFAKNKLTTAIKNGELKPASKFRCADCGVKAQAYDHRDYSKPLDVVPVCTRCNLMRGSGKGAWK